MLDGFFLGGTHIFDPFLVLKQPDFEAFWDFLGAKTGDHKLKMCHKHLFWYPMWSTSIFEQAFFFCCTECTLLNRFAPISMGSSSHLAATQWGLGTGV